MVIKVVADVIAAQPGDGGEGQVGEAVGVDAQEAGLESEESSRAEQVVGCDGLVGGDAELVGEGIGIGGDLVEGGEEAERGEGGWGG